MRIESVNKELATWGLARFIWARVMRFFKGRLMVAHIVVLPFAQQPKASSVPERRVPCVESSSESPARPPSPQAQPLHSSSPHGTRDAEQERLTIRLATASELHNAAQDSSLKLTAPFIDAAFTRGDLCIGAFSAVRLVGYLWVSFSKAPVSCHVWAYIRSPQAYGYKSFVLPEHRGTRVLTRLARVRDEVSLARGCTANVAYIETHNYASYRSAVHAGIYRSGIIGYVNIFGVTFVFHSPGAKKTSLRLQIVADEDG